MQKVYFDYEKNVELLTIIILLFNHAGQALMRFLILFAALNILPICFSTRGFAQAKGGNVLVLFLPSGKTLTVPAVSTKERQYWAENWQRYADTDSTNAIILPSGILADMLVPGYTLPTFAQEYLDSLALSHAPTSSEALPIYYDTTQTFWKMLWEEHRKEYELAERRLQNIAVIVRKRGLVGSASDSGNNELDILAVIPFVNARAYSLPPSTTDIVFPYLLTNEAHRNLVYSYGGTPLTRLALFADKILTRSQLKKILLPKEGSRSRDTLYTVLAEELRKNTLQTTRRHMTVPESPVIIFDKLQKTVIRCIVSTGRFFAYPGSFSVKSEGNQRLPKYSVVPESLTSVYGNIDQPCAINVIFEEPFWADNYKLVFEYRSQMGSADTGAVALQVLPTSLDPTPRHNYNKLYFGKRFTMRFRLQRESESLSQQLLIEWKLGSQKPKTPNRTTFADAWVGPYIPASAKKVQVSVIWKYPPTGEQVPLLTKETTPEQTGPDINAEKASIEPRYSADSSEVEVHVRKIFVDYEVPIDADSSDRSIKATLANVKFGAVALDTGTTKLKLKRDKALPESAQKAPEQPLFCRAELMGTEYNPDTAEILVRVRIKKPVGVELTSGQPLRVQGVLGLRASASIVNDVAGCEGRSDVPLQIPLQIGN